MTLCLLGESDWFLARLLTRFGEACGLEMAHAEVGEELLAMTRRLSPAVVITEPDLPGTMRGWQVIAALHDDPQLQLIPIVAFTWLTQDQTCARIGPTAGYLAKPDVHFEEFVAALETAGIHVRPVTQE